MARISSFAPVYAQDAEILILGSMPSVQSLAQGFYYAHPRNAFWRILSEIYGREFPQDIPEKCELIISNRLALWDSIASCERPGSLDSDIRAVQANDFRALFEACPHISRICFNGRESYKQFRGHAGEHLTGRKALLLPSTSPAYTMKYEEKREIWKEALLKGKGVEV